MIRWEVLLTNQICLSNKNSAMIKCKERMLWSRTVLPLPSYIPQPLNLGVLVYEIISQSSGEHSMLNSLHGDRNMVGP